MLAEYSLNDWLELHCLNRRNVIEHLRQVKSLGAAIGKIPRGDQYYASNRLDFDDALHSLVIPALSSLLGPELTEQWAPPATKISIQRGTDSSCPHFKWQGGSEPEIQMAWFGTVEDLMCLCHEMAHAAQAILSKNEFMPPVARECCAFIGELALLRHLRQSQHEIHDEAQWVWLDESYSYYGEDANELESAVRDPSSAYAYRQNYPIARLLSATVFSHLLQEQAAELFSSGSEAMPIIRDLAARAHSGNQLGSLRPLSLNDEALRISMSSHAFELCQTSKIKPSKLSQLAQVSIVNQKRVEDSSSVNPKSWVRWRSLGLFALMALKANKADVLPADFLSNSKGYTNPPENQYSLLYPWLEPNCFDVLTALGVTIHQLAGSPYHQQFLLSRYLPVEILPALENGQIRCYSDISGEPMGIVTWAWLEEKIVPEIHATGRSLASQEWVGGAHLFFNDWITDRQAFRPAMNEMCGVLFSERFATSIRRNQDGSVRKINRWIGKKFVQEETL